MGAAGAAGDRDARRRLRAEGARGRRPAGRRRHHPARRPGHHPVDHGHGPEGRRGGRPRSRSAQVHRQRAEPHLRRSRRRPRAGALVPGDGLEPRPGPDRPLRHRRLGGAEGADGLRRGAEVLRLQRALPRRREARRVRQRRDLRPLLRARHHRAGDREAARARVDRRRPVQHLPDDARAGGDARDLRPRHPAAVQRGRGVETTDDVRRRWDAAAAGWEAERELVATVNAPVTEALLAALRPQPDGRRARSRRRDGRHHRGGRRPGGARDLDRPFAGDGRGGSASRRRERGAPRHGHAADRPARTRASTRSSRRFGYMLVPDPARALRETRRVLRAGGPLAFATWAPAQRNPWATAYAPVLIERGLQEPPKPGEPGQFASSSREEIEPLVRAAGFDEVSRRRGPGRVPLRRLAGVRARRDVARSRAPRAARDAGRGHACRGRRGARARIEPFRSGEGYALPGRRARDQRALEDRLAERARDELDCERARSRSPGRGSGSPRRPRTSRRAGLRDELECEVRLAVGEAAADRSSDAGRDLRVERVHVERDVHEAGAGDLRQRLADRPLDPDPVDVAHRVRADAELANPLALALVERPQADERDAARVDRRQRPHVAREAAVRETERGGERHPVHVAGGGGLGRVQVAVRVEPEHAADAAGAREPAERSQRDGVVAAEHERQRVLLERERDEPGDAAARRLDLRQVARAGVRLLRRLQHGGLDVAPVEDVVADRVEPVVEPRVADRGRAHVDAAAAGAEVERGADDRDLLPAATMEPLSEQSAAAAATRGYPKGPLRGLVARLVAA